MSTITSADFANTLTWVEGSMNTFIFNVATGSDTYGTGGITLNLPKGYVAIGGVASVSAAPSANVAFASVQVTSGVAKLYCYNSSYAESNGQAVTVTAIVKAKKG